jgi:hypothetical protein
MTAAKIGNEENEVIKVSAEEEKEATVSNEEENEESDTNMNPGNPLPNSTPKKGQTTMDAIERRRSPRLDKGKRTKKLHDEQLGPFYIWSSMLNRTTSS